jgi:D-alanyl-D-alanine carboxypeptidase
VAILLVVVLGMAGSASAASATKKGATPKKSRVATAVRVRGSAPTRPAESLLLPRGVAQPAAPRAPESVEHIRAAAAVLMDGQSGEVLFARNPDDPRPPASVTKILTALVILERGRLGDMVQVSRAAAETGGHRLGLQAGQRISLGDLVAAILIRSANDAAVAAAEHVGGDLLGFVTLMNAKAGAIGMRNSLFANPHGLDEIGHYTTAMDMALLARVALEHPAFAALVRAPGASVTVWRPAGKQYAPRTLQLVSHNRLLGQLEGADGVKTGYTGGAGRCLVASASRGDSRMIAVLLNDPHRWTDAAALLEFGFGAAKSAARGMPAAFDRQAIGPTPYLSAAAGTEREEHP